MSKIQKIKTKRTDKTLQELQSTTLDYGEPLFVKSGYVIFGAEDNSAISTLKVGKLYNQSIIDKSIFYTGSESSAQLINDTSTNVLPKTTAANVSYSNSNLNTIIGGILNGTTPVPNATNATTATNSNNLKTTSATSGKYYILGVVDTNNNSNKQVFHAAPYQSAPENTTGIYFDSTGVLFGSAWNDFAEFRKCFAVVPGTCVVETGDGSLEVSESYLLPAASIITDTFGMVIGNNEEDSQPIAVAGRVLAFVENKDILKAGDALKTAPAGKLAKMTRREIRKYPDRIVGYVSEIPTYEIWNDVDVNGRVWVKIK